MVDVDGRKLGGTGEFRGDNTPDNDYPRHEVHLGEVDEVDCEKEDGREWRCEIDGFGGNTYPRGAGGHDRTYSFDELNISGAEVDRMENDGKVRTVFRFPSGGECHMDEPSFDRIDRGEQDSRLVCSR
jgi:hypothetical protein